jgi:hypothetical protein
METSGYFCHNGHSLVTEEVRIDSAPSIRLLVNNGDKEGIVYFSTVRGSKLIKSDIKFNSDDLFSIMCPECKEELDNIAPCPCSKGSKFVAVYVSRARSFNESVGVCNRHDCSRLYLSDTWKIISGVKG